MNADLLLGKKRTESTSQEGRWLDFGLLVVVLSLVVTFGLLRVDHSRQLDVTRKAIFLFSQGDAAASAKAAALRTSTGIRALPLEWPETRETLKLYELQYEGPEAALILPSEVGWIQVRDEKTIEEALAPLRGVPTPHLLGAFAALFLAAAWIAGRMWRSSLSYFGAIWPITGIVALGAAAPFCPGCALAEDLWKPLSSILSVAGFALVLGILGFRQSFPRVALYVIAAVAIAAGVAQAAMLFAQPKFCTPCLVAGVAWVGTWAVVRKALEETRIRSVALGRPAVTTALIAAAYFGMQHGRIALASSVPTQEKDFHSLVGAKLAAYTNGSRPHSSGLYVVELANCGACELAQKRLKQRGFAFQTLSYCTILRGRGCFEADFASVSPLFLVCDRNGAIQYAEAGWSDEPYEIEQFSNRITKQLGYLK